MPVRKAHGRAAELGAVVVYETTPVDELPAVPEGSGVTIDRDGAGRVTGSEAARRLAALRNAKPDFVRADIQCAPDFVPYNVRRKEWTRRRVAEIHTMTGGVSVAVGAIIRGAGWAVAFGEYLAAQGAATGDPDLMDRSVKILGRASVELAKAYEIAAREAAARPRRAADVPWLISTPAPAPKAPAVASHAPQDAPAVVPPAATTPDQDEPATGRLAPTTEEPHS